MKNTPDHIGAQEPGSRDFLVWGVGLGALLIAVFTALGALLIGPALGVGIRGPAGRSAAVVLLGQMGIGPLDWLACGVSSPLLVWLARRYPISRQTWRTSLLLHFLAVNAFVLLAGVVYYTFVLPTDRGVSIFLFLLISHQLAGNLPFWMVIAAIHALEIHRRYRAREVEAAQLQTQLAETRLEALTAQLHPHFLFNTLQGISTLMHRDVHAADAMLAGLSDLLRQTLQREDRQEVPLWEELDILDHYVGICRERFKGRLVFEAEVAAETREALVPFFILQPLVENALHHGIARHAGSGRVTVVAKRQGEALRLSVVDDGPGLANQQPGLDEGVGLSNTKSRLRQLYGDQQRLTLETPSGGGLRVVLTIPYRTASTLSAVEEETS